MPSMRSCAPGSSRGAVQLARERAVQDVVDERRLPRAADGSCTAPRRLPGPHDRIAGIDFIDKVIEIDQSPIGRTPLSNPATYTGLFTFLRELFAMLLNARARGFRPGGSRST